MLKEYPFKSHYFKNTENHKLHYVDEGSGDPMLLIHGNPTWSFYYRNFIKEFSKTNRTIALDNLGCGFSDKPQDYDYCLKNHIENLCQLVNKLELKNITLVVHDWGGAIGMGMAVKYPEKIKNIVLLNTAAFNSKEIPSSIALCKAPIIGDIIIRAFNGFAYPATFMAVKKKLDPEIKKGYLLPYNNFKNRVAINSFVKDIPLNPKHKTYETLKGIEDNLAKLTCPKLLLWGEKDFCFNMNFFNRFREIYPDAEYKTFPHAGHYVIEDAKDEAISRVKEFIK
ncbi:MAG: alpha/beta hydrolase [Epsilonproteobacteria bacterium]|nr:MAG: alpha/beta hydrolase [Campylobacterota bacterium]RLA65783.1 MAG: alpha/beta hydrolase [Campylobacterota bacterium]